MEEVDGIWMFKEMPSRSTGNTPCLCLFLRLFVCLCLCLCLCLSPLRLCPSLSLFLIPDLLVLVVYGIELAEEVVKSAESVVT